MQWQSQQPEAIATTGTASRTSANHSRRTAARLCRSDRDRRRSLTLPFLRTRRSLNASFRLIDASRRVIDASERGAAGRPIRATRQLERVSGWLADASAQLERAGIGIRDTTDRAAQSPELAPEAPRWLTVATARLIDAAGQIAALSERLDDTFTGLVDYVKSGVAPLDLHELFEKDGPAPRLITSRCHTLKVLSLESTRIFRIHIRRRRSARLTIVEAPRRIFRGRAPPLVSACSF